MHLKQSTASQSVLIGPFVDSEDGATAETALTISNTDIRLSKNGGNMAAKNSGGGTHDENGYYQITLDATDTDTIGRLQVTVNETGALPVYHEFEVVDADVYDAIYGSGLAQPGQATPPATTNLGEMVAYLYKAWRNRHTQTANQYSLYNDDATTVDQKSSTSDDGTTFSRGEVATGP